MPRRILRTKTGRELTQADVVELAQEAEVGYDLSLARRRPVGRPSLGEAGVSPRVSVRVDASSYRALRKQAAANATTVSAVARRLLEGTAGASANLDAGLRALSHTQSLVRSMALPSASITKLIDSRWLADMAPTFSAAQLLTLDVQRIVGPLGDLYRDADRMAALLPKLEIVDHIAAACVAMEGWLSSPAFAAPQLWGPELARIADSIAASAQRLLPILTDLPDVGAGIRNVAFEWRTLLEGEGTSIPAPISPDRIFVGGRGVLGVNLAAAARAGIAVDVDDDLLSEESAPRELRSLLVSKLRQLDEMLPDKLEGAWERVSRPGPDAASQAASSLVEVLDWSLRRATEGVDLLNWLRTSQLASTNLDQHGRPTRALRVRYLCRDDPSGDIVEAFVRIISETYSTIQSVKHKGHAVDPVVVQRLIPTVEAVLTFVFAR